ncbi:hypothetical protein Pan241w_19420 [Gimesia alba]|uniref:Uncharacterized protein n=1 Tax=Gimesia alba TaxID=2527973 RepID=A0A517RDE8_9PLAN|nr:hypothetical protein Pan241w_19420 [Gimesia alba]
MSYHHRDRKKRLRRFRSIYRNGEIQSGHLKIEPVHFIPETIQPGDEFDFWFNNGKDLYLVTLERSPTPQIHYVRTNPRSHLYIRLQLDFDYLSPSEIITIFKWINELGLPGHQRIKQSKQVSSPLS